MGLTKQLQSLLDSSVGWIVTQLGAITTKTDLITITGAVDLDNIPSNVPPVDDTYADLATMFADQGNQTTDYFYYVTGSTAHYQYLGTTVGDITDYNEVSSSGESNIPPMHIAYANFAAMIADQSSQLTSYFYYVTQSQTYYEYLGTTVGDITDYRGGGVLEDKWKIFLSVLDTIPSVGQVVGLELTADKDYDLINFFLEYFDAPSGGVGGVDIKIDGVSIFNTIITVDDGEKNTLTASTPYVTNNLSWNQGEVMTFFNNNVNGAKTPILTMKTTRQ